MSEEAEKQPEYELTVTQKGNPTIITVRIPVQEGQPTAQVVSRITSYALRDEIYGRRGEFGLDNYGVAVHGPYRLVTDTGERTGKPVAYERDFKFTRGL